MEEEEEEEEEEEKEGGGGRSVLRGVLVNSLPFPQGEKRALEPCTSLIFFKKVGRKGRQ